MAEAATFVCVRCPLCRKDLSSRTERGRSTHHGQCRKRREEAISTEQAAAAAGSSSTAVEVLASIVDSTDGDDAQATPLEDNEETAVQSTTFSPADLAWLHLYFRRSDLKMSLLDDVMKIGRLGPSSFTSGKCLTDTIDALPGPEFKTVHISLDDVGKPYTLLLRDILQVATTLLERFNGAFCDSAGTSRGGDFVDGERFQRLRAKLESAAGEGVMLMPLVLSSG